MPTESLIEKARIAKEARAARDATRRDAIATRRLESEIKLDEICLEHGWTVGVDVAVAFTRTGDMAVVSKPKPAVFQAFSSKVLAGKSQPSDYWSLVKPCVVHPDAAKFLAMADENPGMVLALADLCGSLAIPERDETEGK